MIRRNALVLGSSLTVLCLVWRCHAFPASGAEEPELGVAPESAQTNVLGPLTNEVVDQEVITADKAWRSFLQVQGQLDTALLALERNRREGESTALENQKKINDSLKSIERVLQTQQEREILALRESNRNMLIVAGAFAGVGFLAMLLTSLFHLRSMNRLASIATALPMANAYGPATAGLLSPETERLLAAGSSSPAGQRLLHAIEKLEQRVVDLEHTSLVPKASHDAVPTLEAGKQPATTAGADHGTQAEPTDASEPQERLSSLLGKGQALLSLGKAEEALLCFDQALDIQPNHAETLLKKGSTLERLNRPDEAIECYDQAIAANNSMTLAYLYKGGLFNRMEKYHEALACYELALKTQQHPEAPQPG